MKILVTGFEPFGGETINPAYLAVKALPSQIGDCTVITAEIPTAFGASGKVLRELIAIHSPEMVLCVGQAGGRASISYEKVAINLDDARIPDNLNQQPIDLPIYAEGPAAYFTNLPIKAMVVSNQNAEIPAHVSYSAGTYVCNHIFYDLMHYIAIYGPEIRGGFVHVPFCETQVTDKPNMPSMSLATITRGLVVAIEAALENRIDLSIATGTEC